MSIALDRNGNSGNGMIPQSRRFIHGMPCILIYDTKGFDQDRRLELEEDSSTSRSLSVGNNSDKSNGSSEGEVQSSFKGPLDTMDQLEEVLPVKAYIVTWLRRMFPIFQFHHHLFSLSIRNMILQAL
ncbi:hypothetical protein RchiOBHm_Chr3g0491201 [Rosa chinensis]|uniref:Uncharacterized protein n=1 Tax=Rosa chinensis TaxID=74649 RepID=A0A2P6RG66_ROSCH|nr:hypothetical protein RchiOBHm_Chr3g0491201 [Rosa chinensis]